VWQAAQHLYGQVFGWDAEPLDDPDITYVTWKLDGQTVAGMLEMNEQWARSPPTG
jgi:uncharacterized protein